METTLNDRWSRAAAQVRAEEPAPRSKPRGLNPPKPAPAPGSALAVAGLTADQVRKLAVQFNAATVKPADKQGLAATQSGSVVSVWIEVTPEMARRWLLVNFRNRPMSQEVVAAYARDMAAGRWQPTHQGIAFNDRDQLIDGQHRLSAVQRHGKPVRMMVTLGLPSAIAGTEMTTMDCVDRGRPRSVADQLKIQHSLKEGSLIASVSASVAHLCVGEKLRRLSVGQTLDIYRAFQPGMDYVIAHRVKTSGLKSAALLAAFAFAHAIPGAEIPRRYHLVLHGGPELVGAPALAGIREFLLRNESLVMMRNLHRGIAEFITYAVWMDMFHPRDPLLKVPEDWLKGVEWFRAQQPAPVAKVAALFKLP